VLFQTLLEIGSVSVNYFIVIEIPANAISCGVALSTAQWLIFGQANDGFRQRVDVSSFEHHACFTFDNRIGNSVNS